MKTETLNWSGEATVEVRGVEYSCAMDVVVEMQQWAERHQPFYSEDMSEALVTLESFECTDPGGHQVIDRKLLRDIRAELTLWVSDNEVKIVKEAK